MTDTSHDPRREVPLAAILVAVVVALAETLGGWALAGGIGLGLDPIGLVLVGLSVAVGRPARAGSAAGLLAAGALLGDWSGGVVHAVAGFVATALAVRLWPRRDGDGSGRVGVPAWLLRYGFVAAVAVLAFAATSAWLSDVIGRATFAVTVRRTVLTALPLALLGAPLVRPVVERASGRPWRDPGAPLPRRSRVLLAATVACWTLGGYVGSFLFGALELAPPGSVGRRISPAFESFVALWGPGGTYAQLLLGMAAVAVLTVLLRRE
jgi:hypothetical protein